MEFSKTWDLDKYKSEFESDEHWQLRKKFMEAHKNEFPEEKLVCLARVFCNIEFLGCRYPEKTMKLVAELSKGVADNYREKQKGKLKRTFVQASDAAGAKIKGRGATPPSKTTEGPPSKITKSSNSNPSAAGFKYSCFVHEGLVKPPVQQEGEFPGFIIYESCKTNCPISILSQSAQKSKTWNVISFDFPAEKNLSSSLRCCKISLNQKGLSSGVGLTNKEAKIIAATVGLNKLRQTCYTIQEKLSFFTDKELVSKEQVVKGKDAPAPLPQDNIGSKMMMKMGWTGAGLGKNQQGIQAPIEASQTMRRAGFGHLSTPQFHAKFRNVFKDYIASGSTNDLVFAPDFSAEERKTLHRSTKSVEEVNQATEEGIKEVDKDDGEDLFGFDSDSEVIFPNSSDEEMEEDCEDEEADTHTCEVCCKLDSLTGEENDDDLFDKMWGTGSDTSGLVNILDSHMPLRKSKGIEDQADNIEVNAEYESTQSPSYKYNTVNRDLPMSHFSQSNFSATLSYCGDRVVPMLPNATNDEDSLLHSRVSTVVSNINRVLEQRAMGQPTSLLAPWPILNPPPSSTFLNTPSFLPALNHQTFPHKVQSFERARIRIFLPDGSFKRFHGNVFKANNELLAFINNQHPARITATYQDLKTIKGLRDLFPELASKLDSEEKLESVCDYQANCDRPTAEIDSKETSDLNTKIETVSAPQLYDTAVTSSDGLKENTGNPSLKNTLLNIQGNFSEGKDDKVTHDIRGELAQSDKMKLASSSDMEIESDLSDNQSRVNSEAISQTQPMRKIRPPRILLTLADGSTVRVNTNYLKYNNYFIRHDRRKTGIAKGSYKPDEIPPPEYSDSSSDESESEWVPKTNLLISEPEGCEIDKVHVLRRRWEQFIVKFGSSKRNPYAKRWQNFVDQSSLDETKYLCQKWKEYLITWNEHEAGKLPASILQPGHELVALSLARQAYIPPCDSSSIDPNLITVYTSDFGKIKISKQLILNNKSWTGRKNDKLSISTDKTPGFKGNFTELFCQLSKSETTTNPEQLVENSGMVTSKLSEDRYSNDFKTDVSKSAVSKTSVNSVDEHQVVSERGGENNPPFSPNVQRRYDGFKRFRIFLPDGSFKRFHGRFLTANKELLAFMNNQPTPRMTVTYQDLRTNKALRDIFPEFASKLATEEGLQPVPDYQANCDRPTAKIVSKETSDLNTTIKTVSAHQLCDTAVTSSDGLIENTGNLSLKNTLPNIQGNFSEGKDDKETHDIRGELAQSDKMELTSSSDMELEPDLSGNQSSVNSEGISQTQPMRRRRAPRKLFTLADGSTVRVNTNCLKYNNYFIRHDHRKKGIAKGLFKPDEIPPPEYSDSSSDESESEWVPKTNLLISEPESCEIDKVHVLRRRWEQFIVKFGSSKRNPYAKRWQNFVDQSSLDETKYLCQKWKEYLITWNEHEAGRLPASILQPGHELVALSLARQAYIPPCDSSSIDPNLITVYTSDFGKIKISKQLILNQKSWIGRKNDKLPISTDTTPGFKGNFTELFCQLSKSETTTNPEQLVENSLMVTSKLSEDRYSNDFKTDVSKSVVSKTSVNSVDEHKVVSERGGENNPPFSPNVQRRYDGFKRFRIFLPDGSFKRFHGRFLKANKELLAFMNNQPTPRMTVTYQDLRTNKALRDIFPEFASKLATEEALQSVPDYQANCDRLTAEIDSKKICDLNTKIKTVSTHQLSETATSSNDGLIGNTGNPSPKSVTPNTQTNLSEAKDHEVYHETRSESAETNVIKLSSFSDVEVDSELSDSQSTVAQDSENVTCKPTGDRFVFHCKSDVSKSEVTKAMSIGSVDEYDGFLESDEENSPLEFSSSCKRDLPSYTLPVKKRGKRQPKIRLTLSNGCRIRIKASDLRWNKYYMCHNNRLDSIKNGLINPDEIPPPDYSESSTDEEESDWITKSGILITEPENCEIDKNHILRKRWEQYILTLGSSKRNPFAKKWREFVDKSPAGENKTLCQKWKDFMMIIRHLQGATNMPDSVFEEGHKAMTSFSQAGSNTYILSCDSSKPKVTDELLKHLQESTICSTQSDLEKHINSSDLTVVYSSIDSPVSASKNKRIKPKKNKNPNLVTAYLGNGSKVKVDYTLIPNQGTPDWLNRFQV